MPTLRSLSKTTRTWSSRDVDAAKRRERREYRGKLGSGNVMYVRWKCISSQLTWWFSNPSARRDMSLQRTQKFTISAHNDKRVQSWNRFLHDTTYNSLMLIYVNVQLFSAVCLKPCEKWLPYKTSILMVNYNQNFKSCVCRRWNIRIKSTQEA